MKPLRTRAAACASVAIGLAVLLAGSPAGAETTAAAAKLNCVKTKVDNGIGGDDVTATNKCAGTVQVKFYINNDFDSSWRTVKRGDDTTYGYAPWAGFDGVKIKYRGKEYFNPG